MSKREDELLKFMSDDERESYEAHQKKVKAARDKAVKRRKAELDFWRQVRERREEVYQYIVKLRAEEQFGQQAAQTPPDGPAAGLPDDAELIAESWGNVVNGEGQ